MENASAVAVKSVTCIDQENWHNWLTASNRGYPIDFRSIYCILFVEYIPLVLFLIIRQVTMAL